MELPPLAPSGTSVREWLQALTRCNDDRIAEIARVTLELYSALSLSSSHPPQEPHHVYLRLIDALRTLSNQQHVSDEQIRQLTSEALWTARAARLKHLVEIDPI
jgi:hypothetical protein